MAGVNPQADSPGGPPSTNRAGRRICHVIDSLYLGGSERQMVEVARRQKAAGYDVYVACLRAEGPLLSVLQEARVPIAEFSPRGSLLRPRGIYQICRFARFLRKQHFDIVHSHDLWSNLMGIPAARMARVPVVISSQRDLGHLDWYTPRRRGVIARLHRMASAVVANAGAVQEFLVRELKVPAQHIRVVRNGVEWERFAGPRLDRSHVLPAARSEDMLITLVANMHGTTKGHAVLIEAAPEICARHSEARFVLVGDGEERRNLEARVSAAGLDGRFFFLGRSSDVADVLGISDIFVLPSEAEGMPNAVLEAMAANLPVVTTAVGGVLEIIDDGRSGLLVPPRDSAALGAAILRLLDDPEFASRLARSGAAHVRAEFGFARVLANLEELYDSLLAGTRRTRPQNAEVGAVRAPNDHA